MSNKIGGYYLPNKVANDYIANKRSETGEYVYEGAIQDIGMETQAAIHSLNKSYSNVINDAYSSYLNSKRSILNSNLGQGYKEAYMQRQEAEMQNNIEQATLSASETKQEILKQQAESEALVGKAFQNEVINMEKVATNLSGYMEYLKTISNGTGSYYDAIIQNKGLSEYAKANDIYAEDIYDELYNAAPLNYMTEDEVAGLNWMDWLKTQVKTEKDQEWYDWYIGEGGYEQFQDAYTKSASETGAYKYLLAESEKKAASAAEAALQAEYNQEKLKAQEAHTNEIKKLDNEIDAIAKPEMPSYNVWEQLGFNSKRDKYETAASSLIEYGKKVGLDDSEILEAVKHYYPNINTNKDLKTAITDLLDKYGQDVYEYMVYSVNEDAKKKNYVTKEFKTKFTYKSYDDWKAEKK